MGGEDLFIVPINGTSLDDAMTFGIEFWFRADVEATAPDCLLGTRSLALISGQGAANVGVGLCDGEVRAYLGTMISQTPPGKIVIG